MACLLSCSTIFGQSKFTPSCPTHLSSHLLLPHMHVQQTGDEVDSQGQGLDTLHSRAENTVGRIQDVNNKSQLRKFNVSGAVFLLG